MDESESARRRLLEKGFALASSGQHRDHRTILAEPRSSHEYPLARFDIESPAVLKQFDMICVESRRKRPAVPTNLQKPTLGGSSN
jgi:hypothetical protein